MELDDSSYILYWDEDEEVPVHSNQGPINIEEELNNFRQQWQQEIQQKNGNHFGLEEEESVDQPPMNSLPSHEEEAKYLFLQGVNAEQCGKLCDAIQYYRRAVQLVPDIEFRIEELKSFRKERPHMESESSLAGSEISEGDLEDLISYFHKLQVDELVICQPEVKQNGAHLSHLPVEVLIYIFKWVVSSDLDVQSLENLALVCRGFYLFARDEELWRMICQRVWGPKCGESANYGSYRAMYFERPHMRFNGCYISRCTYYRQGEASFDSFYRPFQMVEYFRYVRFFPEGQVLMVTSPETPSVMVSRLRTPHCGVQGLLYGYYKTAGDQITAVLKRRRVDYTPVYRYRRQKNRNNTDDVQEQTFHVEFQLKSSSSRRHSILTWVNYAIHTKYKLSDSENIADFELNKDSYPALVFSRVKSYTAQARKPLAGI